MTDKSRKQFSLKLTQARKALAEARTTDDQREISVAAANLGLALFKVNKFKEGEMSFHEAERTLKNLDDFYLQVHCLSVKSIAYQISEQYPQAFQTAQEIETLAKENKELGVESDALATQGQVLIDSGEEVYALEKFNAALDIAKNINDKRRQMNVTGALGNYCMSIASPEQAKFYFEKARDLACELEDRQSEIGFDGNLGALLEWEGKDVQARDIFEKVFLFVSESGNHEAEIQVLLRLTQINIRLNDDLQIVKWARQGVKVTQAANDDNIDYFTESLITALYRLEQFEEAHQAIKDAVEIAHLAEDYEKEIDLLLNLGESYLIRGELEEALKAYQQSLPAIERLQRLVDRGYVLGRIGMILAELGYADESMRFHEQALALARNHDVVELEGEQLVMLAIAYQEKQEFDQARLLCKTAVTIYTKANLSDDAEKAQELLAQIEANAKHYDEIK